MKKYLMQCCRNTFPERSFLFDEAEHICYKWVMLADIMTFGQYEMTTQRMDSFRNG